MLRHGPVMITMLAVIGVGYGFIAGGCSKADLSNALDKAKNAVTEGAGKGTEFIQGKMEAATDQVQEELNLAGSFDLIAGDPLKTKACYVRLIPQGSGRPTVLQLQSYRDAEHESFPSVFLQAHVQANSLADLVDEPISARLFVQREAEGPILFSETSAPVEFKITAVDGQVVSAELTRATLRETTTGAEIPVTGRLSGVSE